MASREARIDDESSRRAADRELARRALRGDAEAQRELVRRMTPLVWSLCRRSGLPPTEAEDVSQEVFISALDALPRFRGECRLSTWFSTLTLRRASDYRRAPARRDIPSGVPSDADFPVPIESAPSPEANATAAQRANRVRCALERLAEPARSVLVAYYLGELPVVEIARVLDMPEGTVKTHLHRGRQTLRQQLRDLS
jgi:RNA polymerase sigma-70 factor (ECF subfamily)